MKKIKKWLIKYLYSDFLLEYRKNDGIRKEKEVIRELKAFLTECSQRNLLNTVLPDKDFLSVEILIKNLYSVYKLNYSNTKKWGLIKQLANRYGISISLKRQKKDDIVIITTEFITKVTFDTKSVKIVENVIINPLIIKR